MQVLIRKIRDKEEEKVVLECVEMTKEFEDIKDYVLMKGNILTGYIYDAVCQVSLSDVLYFEAVGEQVFAYTENEVYQVKVRLYEVEEQYRRYKFVRCSKSVIVNLTKIESFRPALDSRLYAKMKNGEDIVVSRMYAKEIKKKIMEGER